MATLKDYYDTDFTRLLNIGNVFKIQTNIQLDIPVRLHFDFDFDTKYISYYIPKVTKPLDTVAALLNVVDKALEIADKMDIKTGLPGENLMESKDLKFSGRIFFYSESDIEQEELKMLQNQIKQNGWSIQFRGPKFAMERSKVESPLAFISHDTRDKDDIARPIAIGLSKLMCPVWFDEYSLKVGDKLRESIEKGIRECGKCILILSPNFLANNGWTKIEFNSIFAKELIDRTDLVLPVWCGISEKELYEYCPSLVNKVGVNITVGVDEVIRQLYHSIAPGWCES